VDGALVVGGATLVGGTVEVVGVTVVSGAGAGWVVGDGAIGPTPGRDAHSSAPRATRAPTCTNDKNCSEDSMTLGSRKRLRIGTDEWLE
jgi:hypothetical protein